MIAKQAAALALIASTVLPSAHAHLQYREYPATGEWIARVREVLVADLSAADGTYTFSLKLPDGSTLKLYAVPGRVAVFTLDTASMTSVEAEDSEMDSAALFAKDTYLLYDAERAVLCGIREKVGSGQLRGACRQVRAREPRSFRILGPDTGKLDALSGRLKDSMAEALGHTHLPGPFDSGAASRGESEPGILKGEPESRSAYLPGELPNDLEALKLCIRGTATEPAREPGFITDNIKSVTRNGVTLTGGGRYVIGAEVPVSLYQFSKRYPGKFWVLRTPYVFKDVRGILGPEVGIMLVFNNANVAGVTLRCEVR